MEDIIFSAKQVQGKKALFGKGRFALQNVDFELPSGYIMGIIGENGAGKTTFFRYIMEEKKHYRGSFYLDGTDIAEDHAWSMNRIGFVSCRFLAESPPYHSPGSSVLAACYSKRKY